MKISFVEPHLNVNGGIRRIIELSNHLTRRGHDVTIFHSDGTPCSWLECTAKIKPAQAVLNEAHDALIYNDPNFTDYSLVKKAQSHLKIFYVLGLYQKELLKGNDLRLYFFWRWTYRRMWLIRQSLRNNRIILVNASWMKSWLWDNLGIESTLLLGGVNHEQFRPASVQRTEGQIHLLCSGDPRPHAGTAIIKKAVEIVAAQEGTLKIILDTYYGKGIPQSEMANVYSAADIFIDSQFSAGWNNPVAEAMACGIAVVCTDIGGVHDFAQDGKTALLVAPGDEMAMAQAIQRLIRDPGLRQQIGESAYQTMQGFKWEDSAERLEDILADKLAVANFNPSYIDVRQDVASLIPRDRQRILDLGCSIGTLGEHLQVRNNARVTGVELDAEMAKFAAQRLDRTIVGNVEIMDLKKEFPAEEFDCVICADILEHLQEPSRVLFSIREVLAPNGIVVASIPNIGHISVIANLLFLQYWPSRDRGIYDRTHLRFFTLKSIRELFSKAGFTVTRVERNYRFTDIPQRSNRLAHYVALPGIKSLLTYQYLIVAHKQIGS